MIDNAILALYLVVVLAVGFYFSRKERTSRDYFLAGQHVGWFAIGASVFATNIGSEHFIGLAGSGAATGLAVGAYEWSASFCLFLLAWVFVPHYLASRVFTMPEFLEKRFSRGARVYLTWVSLFAYVFTKISVSLFAGGILIREVFGWDYMTSAVLLVAATGVYTVAGGLAAVIYTDLVQSFILIAGAVLLTWVGLVEVGGFAGLRAALPPEFFHMVKPASDPVYPWTGTIIGTLILGTWYWCTDQVIVQKTLSAPNVDQARKGALFCAALKILPVFILVLPGLVAKALWPTEVTGDNAYPLLVLRLLPAGARGLMIAALLAALMSSLSSVFNSCSTLITMDVYKPRRPQSSERRLVFVGRWATVAMVAVSIVWIPFIRYLNAEIYQYLQSIQATVAAPITATFLVGILWRGATARAAIVTLLVGGAIGAARFLLDVLHNGAGYDLGALNAVVEFSFLNFSVALFALSMLLMWSVSRTGEPPPSTSVDWLTVDWTQRIEGATSTSLAVGTAVIGGAIVFLWYHFA
ncbi:MAG: sodium:solute symporter [Acidobacteriota bacterium]|nr:sodium:solute symporter [Acidobacteriota bacterium]